jgi:hypothetical protein
MHEEHAVTECDRILSGRRTHWSQIATTSTRGFWAAKNGSSLKARRDQVFGAAGDDQLLSGGTQRRERE